MYWVLLLALALAPQGGGARKQARDAGAPQPFARVWRFESDAMSILRPGGDDTLIVAPLLDGRFVALNPSDGSLLWTADPGGAVSASPLVTAEFVIVASARPAGGAEGVLRALDRTTGLAVWVKELPKPISSEMVAADGRIYFGCTDGLVYSVRSDTGAVAWTFPTRGPVRSQILLNRNELLLGSDDAALYAIDRATGAERWRIQAGGAVVARPAVTDRRIYVASGDGVVTALDATTRRVVWRSRTGAAIEAGPVLVGDSGVLVASFDNFVYLLDAKTGDRMWKRRMRGRITSEPILDGTERVIIAPMRDDRLTVLALRDGNRLGAFALDPGESLVAPPLLSSGMLLLSTDTGLVAARAVNPGAARAVPAPK